jgi:hypothetical protein
VRVLTIEPRPTSVGIRLVRPLLITAGFLFLFWVVYTKSCLAFGALALPIALFVRYIRGYDALSRRCRALGDSHESGLPAIQALALEMTRFVDPPWRSLVRSVSRVQPNTLIVSHRRHWALPVITIPPPCKAPAPQFDLVLGRTVAQSLGLSVPARERAAELWYVAAFFIENTASVLIVAILAAWWIEAPAWMLFVLPLGVAGQSLLATLPTPLSPGPGRVRIAAGRLSLRSVGGGERAFVARESCMAMTQDRFAAVTVWLSNGNDTAALQVPADAIPALLACWQAEEPANSRLLSL